MLHLRLLALAVFLLVLPSALAFAQDTQTVPPRTESATVTAAVTADGARFTAPAGVNQMRLEVFSPAGERLFDSGFLGGNVLDWSPGAQPQADGSYLYVVTIRDLSGLLRQRHALARVQSGVASLSDARPRRVERRAGVCVGVEPRHAGPARAGR